MVRNFAKAIACVFLMSLLTITVQATGVQVQDDAGAFYSDEVDVIESSIVDLEEETGWDLIVLTTSDAQGNTSNEYGELFYNANKETEDGVVLVLDFDNGKKAIVTSGDAILYLTDARIENVLAAGDPYSGSQQYGDMILAMMDEVERCYEAGSDGNYIVEENTLSFFDVIIAVIAALVAAGGFTAFIVGKYRLKFGGYKYSFRANGTVKLDVERDRFVNQFVTRRHIPKNDDNGGGGSSVHSGAGGGRFGGGSSKL